MCCLAILPAIGPVICSVPVRELIAARAESDTWRQINEVENVFARAPQVAMPLHHVFTPHLYSRSIVIPADTIATTRIHLHEHPFVISAGIVWVWSDDNRWEKLQASHIGVTKAGTRRILYAETDVVWHTFHVTDETDLQKLTDELTFDPVKLGHLDELSVKQLAALREHANSTIALK